jgi:hypothetical protein
LLDAKEYCRKGSSLSLLHLKSIMANPFQRGVRSERDQKSEGWIETGTARLTQLMPTWDAVYAPQDPDDERVRLDRISQFGARGGLLTYSELAIGVDFVLPQCNVANP